MVELTQGQGGALHRCVQTLLDRQCRGQRKSLCAVGRIVVIAERTLQQIKARGLRNHRLTRVRRTSAHVPSRTANLGLQQSARRRNGLCFYQTSMLCCRSTHEGRRHSKWSAVRASRTVPTVVMRPAVVVASGPALCGPQPPRCSKPLRVEQLAPHASVLSCRRGRDELAALLTTTIRQAEIPRHECK